MRSGTSFFDWAVFKKTICRFWPLWGVYFVIWLVALPLNGLMLLRMDSYGLNDYGSYMEDFAFSRVPNAASDVVLQLAVVFGALAAMAVFSHLYNARSANLFGSLPIRREGLFLTHYLAGLAFLIVPNVVIFLLTLLVELAGGVVCWQGLGFWLAVSCGECFLFYSMAVFCAMFTGHILALPAFYAILNGIAAGVVSLVQLVFRVFYYGYYGYELPGIVLWLTPVVRLEEAVRFNSAYIQNGETDPVIRVVNASGLDAVGIYAIAAAALTVCAFFLYRVRRLESAGDVVAIRPMKPVFKYGVALCAGLTLGVGTVWFTGGGEMAFIIATVVWGVIGYFAAEMLLQKSFKVFRRWKGAAAVAAVFVVLFLVVSLDLTGFETRIPDPASVDSVNVYTANVAYLQDDGDHIYMDVTDQEVIELLGILHREAVAQRDEEWKTQAQLDGVSTSLNLRYTLQGGGTLNRQYAVWLNPDDVNREGTAAWAVQQLYDNHELYWQVYGFDQLESAIAQGGRLESASHGGYNEELGYYEQAVFYGHDASALLAAVREDFFAGRIGVRRVDDKELRYGGGPKNSLTFSAVGQEDSNGYRPSYTVYITIQDTASSTLTALEEMADRAVRPDTDGYWE